MVETAGSSNPSVGNNGGITQIIFPHLRQGTDSLSPRGTETEQPISLRSSEITNNTGLTKE
jgi:hypothetical protein